MIGCGMQDIVSPVLVIQLYIVLPSFSCIHILIIIHHQDLRIGSKSGGKGGGLRPLIML